MPSYEILINRAFLVVVEAETREKASTVAEYYLGYSDLSDKQERKRNNFKIIEIEMTENNAIESRELEPKSEEYHELISE